jgi:hypothetical protein
MECCAHIPAFAAIWCRCSPLRFALVAIPTLLIPSSAPAATSERFTTLNPFLILICEAPFSFLLKSVSFTLLPQNSGQA